MTIINNSILGLLGFFAAIGFFLGIWRGFGKSVIRLFTVLLSAVITVFVAVPASQELFKIDLTFLGANLDGVPITTLDSAIMTLLYRLPYISEFMAISPSLKEMVLKIPYIFSALIVFVIVFIIIKALAWVVYRIIARIVIAPKHKDEERNQHRLLGGFVGLFQGVVCFLVVLMPLLGAVNLVDQVVDTMDGNPPIIKEVSASSFVADYSTEELNEEEEEIIQFLSEQGLESLRKYITPIKDNWFIKTLSFFKFDRVVDVVFDKLTTFEIKKTPTNIRHEALTATKLYTKINGIQNYNIKDLSTEQINNLEEGVEIAFDSVLLKNILSETVSGVSGIWIKTNNNTFAGIGRPSIGGALDNVVYSFLSALSIATPDDIESDMHALVDVLRVTSKNSELNNISEGGSSAINTMGDREFMVDFFDAMLGGPSLKRTIPSMVDTGISFIYPLINVPENKDVVETLFLEKLVFANDNYTDDNSLKKDYKSAFRYYGVKVLLEEPAETKSPYILESDLNQMVADCKGFSQPNEFEEYFADNDMDFVMGKVITQTDLKVKKTSSEVNWNTEKYILADIFSGMANIFNTNDSKSSEQTALDVLNFDEFANVLDAIRRSELLDGMDQALVLAFLQSSIFDGLSIGDAFMDMVKDDARWQQVNFNSLLGALTLVQDMQGYLGDGETPLSEKVVSDLIDILTGEDEATKEIVLELVNKDNLVSSGVEEGLAGAIADIVSGIKDTVGVAQSEGDAKAVQDMITAINNSNSGGNIFETQAAADEFVGSIMKSDIVFAAVITNPKNTSFASVNEQDKTFITTAVENYKTNNPIDDSVEEGKRDEKLEGIKTKFGVGE